MFNFAKALKLTVAILSVILDLLRHLIQILPAPLSAIAALARLFTSSTANTKSRKNPRSPGPPI